MTRQVIKLISNGRIIPFWLVLFSSVLDKPMLMRLINRDQQGKKIYAAETSHRIANDETSGDLWFQNAGKLL